MNRLSFRRSKWTALALALPLVLTACSGGAQQGSGPTGPAGGAPRVIKIAIVSEAEKLDPHWANTATEVLTTYPIFNGLVRFKPGSVDLAAIEPDLADKWAPSADGKTWTFTLHKGVKWHEGFGEVTAADVKWSIERVQNPATGSPWKGDYTNIDKVEAPDPLTVVFTLKQPDPYFLMKVVNYHGGMIVKKEAIEKYGKDSMNHPVGTGPYVFKEYKPKEKIVLEANPDYFRGKPGADRLEFLYMPDAAARDIALKNGDVQIMGGQHDQAWLTAMESVPNLAIDYLKPPLLWSLHLNMTQKPLDDVRVRRALFHAIDRASLAKNIFGEKSAKVATSPVPTGYEGHADGGLAEYPYDPVKAKALLAEAGYSNGFDLGEQVISTLDPYTTLLTFVQEQWRKVGVNFSIKQVDHATYHATVRKDANKVIVYGFVRAPYASVPLSEFFHSNSIVGKKTAVTNFSHFTKIDEFVNKAVVEMDAAKRKDLYLQAQKAIMEDVPTIPLVELYDPFIRRTDLVDLGYKPEGSMIYFYQLSDLAKRLK